MTIPELEAKAHKLLITDNGAAWRQAEDDLADARDLLAQHALAGFVALRACLRRVESDNETPCRTTPEGDAARAALAPVEHLLPKE